MVLESPSASSPHPTRIELTMDATGHLESARMYTLDPAEKGKILVLDQLAFGREIPIERFAAIQVSGVPVVDVEAINPLVLVGQVLQIGSEMMQSLGSKGKR